MAFEYTLVNHPSEPAEEKAYKGAHVGRVHGPGLEVKHTPPLTFHCLECSQSHSHTYSQERLSREMGCVLRKNWKRVLTPVTKYLFALLSLCIEYTHPLLEEETQPSHLIRFKV